MKSFSVTSIPLRGRSLVDASAGTGKTYAISTLFVRLLLETNLATHQLLVVTFTEAATAELRDRIRKRVLECLRACEGPAEGEQHDETLLQILAKVGSPRQAHARLERALQDFDRCEISTIHGFCQRTLVERAFQSDIGFSSELYGDPRPLIDEIVYDFWATEAAEADESLMAHLLRIEDSQRGDGDSRFDVDKARELAYAVLRGGQNLVVPNDPGPLDALDAEPLCQALARAREVWLQTDVEGLLTGSAKLNRRIYNRRYLPTWVQSVTEFFEADPERAIALPKGFERFCNEALEEAGGQDLLETPLVRACQLAHERFLEFEGRLQRHALRFKLALVQFVRRELPRRTREKRALSFDDLLQRLHDALHASGGAALSHSLRQRYPVALIDEFQDTDPVQLGIFHAIYRDAPQTGLFLIGDPKQAIYSFRGADVYSYVSAARATDESRHYTMATNFRSDPSMVAAVNHVFSSAAHPFLLPDIHFRPVRANAEADQLRRAGGESASGLELLTLDEERGPSTPPPTQALPRLIAADISRTLAANLRCKGEPLSPGDIAVLTRTNVQAFDVQSALRELLIPSVVLGDKSVYDSEEAAELEQVLAAVMQPTNAALLRAALATEMLGLKATDLLRLEQEEERWELWLRRFTELQAAWTQIGFVQMIRSLLTQCGVQERLLALPDGERRMTNLLHLIELLHSAASLGHLGPSGLLSQLSQHRRRLAGGMEADAAQIRLESDERAVKITTMHKSKGLEYPIVYCPYLWSGMLLHPSDRQAPKLHDAQGRIIVDIGSDRLAENLEQAEWEQLAENLRLAYVALTRARHRCSVVVGPITASYSTSSIAYLLHPPQATAPPTMESIRAHVRSLSEEEMSEQVRRHALAPGVRHRVLPRGEQVSLQSSAAAAGLLTLRTPGERAPERHRTSSFSGLTELGPQRAGSRPIPVEESLLDRDAREGGEPEEPEEIDPSEAIPLGEFPRGARAGSFFHDILEHLEFRDRPPGALRELAMQKLRAYDYPQERWLDPVCECIERVLSTPLSASGEPILPVKLGDLAREDRLAELEFCFPVLPSERTGAALSATALARAFAEHPGGAVPLDYHRSVARLAFAPLEGYLRGFVDLIYRHDGRYFVVDYKTNHLGPRRQDYGPHQLSSAMAHGHYFLQYHLYTLALHRHLSLRLPGYEYDRHFGGAFYLFLKGMGPGEEERGIFYDKPPPSRIVALDAAMGERR